MKDALYELLYGSSADVTTTQLLGNTLVALALSLIVFITYRFTYGSILYSKKFNVSLIMLTLITTVIMSIIGGNIALSLGMVGALSIVRFRTAVKDPRDTAYIFWTIAIGLGAGSGSLAITIIGTVIISLVCFVFNYGIGSDERYLIIIRSENIDESLENIRAHMFKVCKGYKLRSETVNDQFVELVYQIKLKGNASTKEYEYMKKIKGVISINVVSQNGETLE
ncbi:DUF4956 domain-containing protein [Paenibacillus gallinarum]|uniref:DUF4956 domain-containing protein n=1 Tax=Paenibacillus gallinarum TaxID=2762232 RepID=A0ABR8T2A7_9BACL|nr:DUF4956 domain-containing protein [Paenibacillus gallinarum]MBD7969905.1 DUF4956 domain-containing protein [Paenibacillus gallinarum]